VEPCPTDAAVTVAARSAHHQSSRSLASDAAVPIYEYVCMECESHFEELVRNGEAIACPDCGAGHVVKQLSVFATHGTAAQPSFGSGGGCCGGSCGCGH
jgi:putative FmdB family regulatory protein